MLSLQVILCILRNSLPFHERKDLYLANATTKNLGVYSKPAVKMSFSQTAEIFHMGRYRHYWEVIYFSRKIKQSEFAVLKTLFPIAHKALQVG